VDVLVKMVNLELMVLKDLLVKRENRETKVYKDLQVFQETVVYQDPLV